MPEQSTEGIAPHLADLRHDILFLREAAGWSDVKDHVQEFVGEWLKRITQMEGMIVQPNDTSPHRAP